MSRDKRVSRTDAGLSLVEVLVALGIFGILMAMVSTLMIYGLRAAFRASDANTVQARQQNAIVSMSRLIRFIDNPNDGPAPDPAILQATANSLAFFSWGAAGTVDRTPTRTLLCADDAGVYELTWPAGITVVGNPDPSYSLDVPTCDDQTGVRRVLLDAASEGPPSLTFSYWRPRTDADEPGTGPVEVVANGALTQEQLATVTAISVSIGDPRLAATTDQTIALVNAS